MDVLSGGNFVLGVGLGYRAGEFEAFGYRDSLDGTEHVARSLHSTDDPRRAGKQAQRLFEHKRFRAAYDFLLLRARAGEESDQPSVAHRSPPP